MKITAIKYGQSRMQESLVFDGGRTDATHPISFLVYLIEVDDRKILVDAGCTTMPDCWKMEHFCGVMPILKQLDLSPEDITDVILTHAHHDHIESVSAFTNATVYIQQDELSLGRSYLPQTMTVMPFADDCTVYSGIRAVKVGGHSIGSPVVQIATDNTVYVITGDECYAMECLTKKILTGASCNREQSQYFIETYSQPCYTPLLCHDGTVLPDQNGYQVIYNV